MQFFLSNPQSWRKPRERDDAARLRSADLPVYVHAPYLVNVASTNNRIRIPSRRILQETCDAATAIGAAAVIVHGGHVDADADEAEGFDNWRKALERVETDMPLFIENTAGGQHAMTRRLDSIARLWEHIGGFDVGFCLDTCHAHAAGEELGVIVDEIRRRIGRIDLVHANNSKDEFGSGRDRHENLADGRIAPDVLAAVVAGAGAPVICETPGGAPQQAQDISWLRAAVPPAGRS